MHVSPFEPGIKIVLPPRPISPRRLHTLQSSLPPLLQLLLNRPLKTLRLRRTRPPALNLPILPNQKLLKIPLDPRQTHQPRFRILHEIVDGLRVAAVDFGLAEHFVRDFVVQDAEVLDLFVGARVLGAELVAGKGQDFEGVWVGGFDVCEEVGGLAFKDDWLW